MREISEPGRAKKRARNPFPDSFFFPVPLRLFDDGVARTMSGAELKRYLTLLRVANFQYGKKSIRLGLDALAMFDGVSPRSAWLVHRKLQERGLITIERTRSRTARKATEF
jgi:hypothetical protein